MVEGSEWSKVIGKGEEGGGNVGEDFVGAHCWVGIVRFFL